MKVINRMKVEFLSLPENVAFARVVVASFASQLDFTLGELDEIKVATSEAVSNSIIHGYSNAPGGLIRVSCTLYEDGLEFAIEDEGKGIADIQEATQAAYSTDPERMGLGFTFMQSFMDKMVVKSELGRHTQVTLVKKIANEEIDSSQQEL